MGKDTADRIAEHLVAALSNAAEATELRDALRATRSALAEATDMLAHSSECSTYDSSGKADPARCDCFIAGFDAVLTKTLEVLLKVRS